MFENEISPLEGYLPDYLPEGFIRNDRSLWYNRTYIGLQLFFHDQKGHFIRLELSDGPIGDLMTMSPAQGQVRERVVKGLKVNITSIKPSSKAKRKEGPPLISAAWQQPEVYFRLQSDGLTEAEVEKIVTSTIR